MTSYEELQRVQARRWAAEIVASLAKGEPHPTVEEVEQDRQVGEHLDQMEARARAVHAHRIVQAGGLEDPDRWVKAAKNPGEWHMRAIQVPDVERGRWTTKTVRHWWKEHPQKVEVPDPYLAWVARGEQHRYDDKFIAETVSEKLAPLREPDLLAEWAEATEDDYQGGPVEWDAHTDHYDLTA